MRNLSLIATEYASFSYANSHLTATAFDLDEDVLYTASERNNSDGEVEVELWRVPSQKKKQTNAEVQASPVMASMFSSTACSNRPDAPQIVNFRVLAEVRRIAAIMADGDIVMVSIDEDDSPAEVEGTFESGILAASWSPDESLLAIVTGDKKLILLTSTFDVLSEGPLHPSEFGEDAPINVGWGSKQTQFHGSLGKTAAQVPTNVKIGSSPDDDGEPRISWRGDGAYFVISSLSPADELGFRRRTLRVYDRQAALQSTSEAVAGLEHVVSWRPSGNLIVGTQRFGFEGGGSGRAGRHDVVFFERNGLRHGEFTLNPEDFKPSGNKESPSERKWGYKIREVLWSPDSNVLGLWIETDHGDIVQLWTTGNYHWYLKHEIMAPSSSPDVPGRFTSAQWHPEAALHIILTTEAEVIQRQYEWDTWVSSSKPPNDSGLVAVLDDSNVLLTPFRTQNVPPPMSAYQLPIKRSAASSPQLSEARVPVHASFSDVNDALAVLWEDGHIQLWALHTRLGPGPGNVMNPAKIWEGTALHSNVTQWKQVAVRSSDAEGLTWTMEVLGGNTSADDDVVAKLNIADGKVTNSEVIRLPSRNSRILADVWPPLYHSAEGEILRYDEAVDPKVSTVGRFPEFCLQTQIAGVEFNPDGNPSQPLLIGLGKSGKLYGTVYDGECHLLATQVNSFTISSRFLVFTTTSHESKYVPLIELQPLLLDAEAGQDVVSKEVSDKWVTRKVERGSRIVVVVPSTMALVLQMPRGNLETINPRPLVMEVVKEDLDAGNYRKAFFSCRKHRLDLNVLVDHDQETFLSRIQLFVEQIPEVDHLNLFLTLIGRGSQSPETVAKICDAIREELEKKDFKKYINSILTAHVMKTPPDYEAGLAQLLRLREIDPTLVEDAVKYIIFLVDAEMLFDIALGMYDFSLVLMIAQHAQKDPREYLPFLRELRALDKYYQRFRIDDHLKRHESALKNLSLAGPERFTEAVAYIERHQLYEKALSIWRETDRYHAVLELYGDWLYERRELPQAAAAFIEAGKREKAMMAFEKNLQWQELFDIALLSGMAEGDVVDTAYRISEDLSSKKRHSDAARVLLDYAKDVSAAVVAFTHGNAFSEARRIITLYAVPELLEEIVYPASLDSRAQISEDIGEMREQLRKQRSRIRELRIRKVEEPDAFYGTEDVAMQNIDVMTDISMAPTTFTRYTVAPTTASRSSRRSSRSKRKAERKVNSGRKGTVDEEEYLLKSVTKLVDRFTTSREEARHLLPHLYQFSPEHRQEGLALQTELREFETEMKESLEEIWAKAEDETNLPPQDSWATRMAEIEKNRHINPIDKVPKPDVGRGDKWGLNLFDL